MSRTDKESLNVMDILENVAVKVRCLADVVACLEDGEHQSISREGLAGLYGFLDNIYDDIRAADACLRA